MSAVAASRVRIGRGLVLAAVFGLGGVVAVAPPVSAAPWTISAVSDGPTAAQLASTLVGPGITVNPAAFTGDASAAGLFDAPAASIGLSRGVILSSGRVHD